MSILKKLKQIIKTDGFVLVRKYIRRSAIITFLISIGVVLLVVIYLLCQKQLEAFIVSEDLKFNSPVIIKSIKFFLMFLTLSILYGVFLSLRDYKRPSNKWLFKHSYENGSSYKALEAYKEFSKNKHNNG